MRIYLLNSLTVLVGVLSFTIAGNEDWPVVQTQYGKVLGSRNQTVGQNRTFYAFRGIPYARPPIGDFRFQPPVALKPWNDILPTIDEPESCLQGLLPIVGSEDCLYINIYTPTLPSQSNILLPVLVWIHGGAFITGYSTYNDSAPDYFLEKDVVVVMFGYRLGVFGFLSTGDLVAPGNNGLRDQIFALQWIKENIINFGGDPNKITLFGESAGAASVSYFLQIKSSEDLFHGAIMESGSSLCLWALSRTAKASTELLAQLLGVNTSSSETLLNGLKEVDGAALLEAANVVIDSSAVTTTPRYGFAFGPVIEPEHPDAVITFKSHELLSKGDFHRVPTIIGYNSQEAFFNMTLPLRIYVERFDLNQADLTPVDMNIDNSTEKLTVGTKIRDYYWDHDIIAVQDNNIVRFISEDVFVRPIWESVNIQSRFAPVYYYRFSYKGILGNAVSAPGAVHTEELNYLFVRNSNATESDRLTRDRMVTLWTNFAKYGNPTPFEDLLLGNTVWPVARQTTCDTEGLLHLEIGEELEVEVGIPEQSHMLFWKNLYNKVGKPPFDTY